MRLNTGCLYVVRGVDLEGLLLCGRRSLTEALAKLSVVLAMAGSWTRAYLFGGDSPPNRTALKEEGVPEFDLEPGVSSIGSGVGSVGVGSILREHSQSLEGRSELEAAAEADQRVEALARRSCRPLSLASTRSVVMTKVFRLTFP